MNQGINKILIILTVMLMDLLAGMEFDLFVPSFPEIRSQLNLTPFLLEALLSINFIGYCISLFLVGSFADRYGRKPIILIGMLIFILGSSFALWASSYPYLLIGRLLQGIGIASPAILSFLVIADNYPLKEQQYYMAMLNAVMNTAVAIAPVIGSFISLHFHWQGNFATLLIIAIITLTMTMLFVPSTKPHRQERSESTNYYSQLLKSPTLLLLMANIIAMFVPYWIFVGMSPLLYMKDLGVSLSHFGYYQGVLALVFALGSLIFGMIMRHYRQLPLLKTASVLYWFSLFVIIWVTAINTKNPLLITVAFIPFIISQIIPSNMLVPVCLNYIPHAKAKISAVLQGSRLLFAALSLEIAGYFYRGNYQSIGVIIAIFILFAAITHMIVLKNQAIMKRLQD